MFTRLLSVCKCYETIFTYLHTNQSPSWEIQILVSIPVGFVLSLILCWRLMGPSVLLGVAVLGTSQGINVFVARAVRNREKIRRKHTDTRLQETSQYVEAIRHLRWYGWHQHWMDKIITARQSELNWKIIVSLLYFKYVYRY